MSVVIRTRGCLTSASIMVDSTQEVAMIWTVLLAAWAWAMDCSEPTDVPRVTEVLDAADEAWMNLDDDGFRDRVNEVSALILPCIDVSVEPPLAARYHRTLALQLLVIGDEATARGSLQAARIADPEFTWDDDLVPADHPARVIYDELGDDAGGRKVPEPRVGSLSFDGVNTRVRPDHPTIFQQYDGTGQVMRTKFIGPKEPLPVYSAVPRTRNALIGCSAGAAVLSATLYGLAIGANNRLYTKRLDMSLPREELDPLKTQTQVFTITSGLVFGGAAACGTAAALVGER